MPEWETVDERRLIGEKFGSNPSDTVDHNSKGEPTHPDDPYQTFDITEAMFRDGEFIYRDMTEGVMAPQYYEPVAAVNDNRLLDYYRATLKADAGRESPKRESELECIGSLLQARGMDVPEISQWYITHMTREQISDAEEELPEIFNYSAGTERETESGETLMHVRFTNIGKDVVEAITETEIQAVDGVPEPRV